MTGNRDRTFEAFKHLVPHLRGALWWAQDDLIKDRHPAFNQADDRKGHPLLSVSQRELRSRFDAVPMLVGTSGKMKNEHWKSKCVMISGMTRQNREHKTYFGSIVQPGLYSFEDLLTGVKPLNRFQHETGKWYNHRTMIPNWDKSTVNDQEMKDLNAWCDSHGN